MLQHWESCGFHNTPSDRFHTRVLKTWSWLTGCTAKNVFSKWHGNNHRSNSLSLKDITLNIFFYHNLSDFDSLIEREVWCVVRFRHKDKLALKCEWFWLKTQSCDMERGKIFTVLASNYWCTPREILLIW